MSIPKWATALGWTWSNEGIDEQAIDDTIEKYKPLRVFEWGAGISSIVFPERHGFINSWTAVDNNPTWAESINRLAKERNVNTIVHCRPNVQEYLKQFLLTVKFSGFPGLVFVDGRWRKECLLLAAKTLPPRTPVLLHDFSRSRYWPGIQAFERRTELTPPEQGIAGNDHEPSEDGKYWHKGVLLLTNSGGGQ